MCIGLESDGNAGAAGSFEGYRQYYRDAAAWREHGRRKASQSVGCVSWRGRDEEEALYRLNCIALKRNQSTRTVAPARVSGDRSSSGCCSGSVSRRKIRNRGRDSIGRRGWFRSDEGLAHKKIAAALHTVIKRGHHPNVPLIGVAKSGRRLDNPRARAKDSIERYGGIDPNSLNRCALVAPHRRRLRRCGVSGASGELGNPIFKVGSPVYECERSSRGPAEADELVAPPRGWHNPAAGEEPASRSSAQVA